ncbi:MAG TPA: endonuclease/exonuclease/phosphatase family protein [Actinomycetota bacterium]|nr:endonuclease/exonuclease/phosphatase family protein [Actinomycetota bacterium]
MSERPFRFMTFNIRFATPADDAAGHGWTDRRDPVVSTIRACAPDVLGVQEALRGQLDDLVAGLPDHQVIGKPREVGDKGEYVPLFVHRRFEIEQSGDFWLSSTPEVEGSLGWDAPDPRHCTWARLRDAATGVRFAVFNTHLDRWGLIARVEAVRLIAARVALAPELAAVVMGDFNEPEDSEALDLLRASGLRDTFRVLHPAETNVQTVHQYTELPGTYKIDYVMCDARWTVHAAEIVRRPAGGRLPSDHYPVVATLSLPEAGGAVAEP